MDELSTIKKYFTVPCRQKNIIIGSGDDCAVVAPESNQDLAISCDTMVENTHFTKETPPEAIAHKLIASNIADIAAMGATPKWITLSVSLPKIDTNWLDRFSKTLKDLLLKYKIDLIGGDTTQSATIVLSATIHGLLPKNQAIKINTAKPGDLVFVTGNLGDSRLGLEYLNGKSLHQQAATLALNQHYYPKIRANLGEKLLKIATSCTDISDGLYTDLQKITNASQVNATIDANKIPLSSALTDSYPINQAIEMAIAGGEDYELLFTVQKKSKKLVEKLEKQLNIKMSEIGVITKRENVNQNKFNQANKQDLCIHNKIFQHFYEQ